MENTIKQDNNFIAGSQTFDNKPIIKEGQTAPKASAAPVDNSSRPIPSAPQRINAGQEKPIRPPDNKRNIPASSKPNLPAPEEINETEQEPPEEIITAENKKTLVGKNTLIKKQNSVSAAAQKKNFEQILEVGLSPVLEEKVHISHQKDKNKILISAKEKNNIIKDTGNNEPIKISSEMKKAEKLKKTAAGAPNLLNPMATIRPEDSIDPPSEIAEEKKTPFAIPKISPETRKEELKPAEEIIPESLQKIIPDQPKEIIKRGDKPPAISPEKYLTKLDQHRNNANQVRQHHVAENLLKILDFAQMHQKITNNEVELLTGVKDDMATIYLNKLVEQGKLVRFGTTKNTFYKPVNNR